MADEADFTITRRACLFGALLAPFARPLKALGLEPKRRGSDFNIMSGGHTWKIRTTEDGKVDCVTFNGKPMRDRVDAAYFIIDTDWRIFEYRDGWVQSDIRFRVDDANKITVDWFCAAEPLQPIIGVKDSARQSDLKVEWFGGDLTKMGGFNG